MAKVFTITEGLENMGALKTGGQGSVYKGRRIGEIITAVKLLPTPIHSETQDDKHFIDFQNEVNKLKKVNQVPNPNVVKIINSGITDSGSFPFIEMEYIEGPDLEELLQTPHDPVFTIKETLKVAEQLSCALAHCHKVDVKHGDIKSNNVKFNINTGNYVLLDFGLAMMSDEQRRTSLRNAGAIEFMAPEQNEGRMLLQTDIYSYGIILYELLAGQVPFPLREKGEMARNTVMLAHMETAPPDLLNLRRKNLPENWSDEKKRLEMQVPHWLLTMIQKCLQKKPEARFSNGNELHQYIAMNSLQSSPLQSPSLERITLLEQENESLRQEKEKLQYLLQQNGTHAATHQTAIAPKATKKNGNLLLSVLGILVAIVLLIFLITSVRKSNDDDSVGDNNSVTSQPIKPRTVIGQYKVLASRAYFHNEPDANSRRNAWMIPSNDIVSILEEKNGFLYTEFTNNRGQTSKGWLRRKDLMPLEEWMQKSKENERMARLTESDVKYQLDEARTLLSKGQVKEALYIYNYLSEQEIPEAMYQYGNLALQNRNPSVDCGKGLELLVKASDKGFTAAKRTLGFLHVFADNTTILRANNYHHCSYDKNVFKGSKLLMEAVLEGDTTASRIMEEINLQRNQSTENIEQ
jgi:serine/threonine-protein kinase